MKGGEDIEASASGNSRAYKPDYAISPGETLAEVLDERGMSQAELARRTGISQSTSISS
jgi:plasmid maintenance system antidote protein VapI